MLIRASAEAKSLRPNPALASRLMQQWHAVKFEVLQPKVCARARTEASCLEFPARGVGAAALRDSTPVVKFERASLVARPAWARCW